MACSNQENKHPALQRCLFNLKMPCNTYCLGPTDLLEKCRIRRCPEGVSSCLPQKRMAVLPCLSPQRHPDPECSTTVEIRKKVSRNDRRISASRADRSVRLSTLSSGIQPLSSLWAQGERL